MDQSENSGPQYFVSMTDMLLGLLIIFLVIVGYLAISFSQSIEKAVKASQLEQEAKQAQVDLDLARAQAAAAEARAREASIQASEAQARAALANTRAEEAEKKSSELQNILISIDRTRIQILRELKIRLQGANFDVEIDEKTGVVRLPEAELFERGKFELTNQGIKNMLVLRDALEIILPCYASSQDILVRIRKLSACQNNEQNFVDAFFVEGHADSSPVRSNIYYKDNQELSTKRAMTAYNILSQSVTLSELMNSNQEFIMSVSGYGANRPLCIDKTPTCYSRNRRIDLRLVMEIPKKLSYKND